MGKMETKYEFFLNQLEPINKLTASYVVNASDSAKFPYAVIDIANKNNLDSVSDEFFLDIDIWHKKNSKGEDIFFEIEAITDEIEKKLHYLRCGDVEHFYIVNQLNRIRVPDSDVYIQRRKLKYHVKSYNYNN